MRARASGLSLRLPEAAREDAGEAADFLSPRCLAQRALAAAAMRARPSALRRRLRRPGIRSVEAMVGMDEPPRSFAIRCSSFSICSRISIASLRIDVGIECRFTASLAKSDLLPSQCVSSSLEAFGFFPKRERYFPSPSFSKSSTGTKRKAEELMQYRMPVGAGPSSKTWPK